MLERLRIIFFLLWLGFPRPALNWLHSNPVVRGESTSDSLSGLFIGAQHIKALILHGYNLRGLASWYFLAIPFSQLQHLKVKADDNDEGKESFQQWHHALAAIVTNSVDTLKKLDLTYIEKGGGQNLFQNLDFPLCPSIQELSLKSIQFGYWAHLLSSNFFPSLCALSLHLNLDTLEDEWDNLPPLLGIKTLRASGSSGLGVRLFEKFSAMERLSVQPRMLAGLARLKRLKTAGDLIIVNTFKSVKHLELSGSHPFGFMATVDSAFSSLAVLQGVETITTESTISGIFNIPFQDMPSVKVIQFPWGNCVLKKLLEVAAVVEKVIVTNCCLVSRLGSQGSKELLNRFFESAPNAQSGCGMGRKWSPLWT